MSPRTSIALGAFLAGLAVAIGAFGAHWLRTQAPLWYSDPDVAARMLENWEVGVRYQMYTALGLMLVGLWGRAADRRVTLAASLLGAGAIIFSGCLYLLVLSGQLWLGRVVPIGGVAMIAGWLVFAWQTFLGRDT